MNHIGRTNTHTLAAFDATDKEFIFRQRAGGTYKPGIPVGSDASADTQR